MEGTMGYLLFLVILFVFLGIDFAAQVVDSHHQPPGA